MLSMIHDLGKIESHGMDSDTGNSSRDYLLTRVNVREDEATPQIQVDDIKHSSFLFKKHDL